MDDDIEYMLEQLDVEFMVIEMERERLDASEEAESVKEELRMKLLEREEKANKTLEIVKEQERAWRALNRKRGS